MPENTNDYINQTNAGGTDYDIHDYRIQEVTSTDNGKFLRVVDGAWAATTVANAEDNSF